MPDRNPIQDIQFTAAEYNADQSNHIHHYRYTGSVDAGWNIAREGKPYLDLGPGYVPVQTSACGVCSTDLARHHLPFSLPQIIGHEVIGIYQGQNVAIEINASHMARGLVTEQCFYCNNQLDIHCLDRLTIGIDRLPGGFSPWVLAPVNAIHTLPTEFTGMSGVLIEPFAAALKAVTVTPPQPGDRIAVLGPRRLGMLIIAALNCYRQSKNINFTIHAVMRHLKLQEAAYELGADSVVLLDEVNRSDLQQSYDVVFDTTGNPLGFELAADMAKRVVHLKSTHGQPVLGLEHLTEIVINEQQLLGLKSEKFEYAFNQIIKRNSSVRVFQSLHVKDIRPDDFPANCEIVSELDENMSQQFEMALVSSGDEINILSKPTSTQGASLLRAGGSIFLDAKSFKNDSNKILQRISQSQLELVTSRCGSFVDAIQLLSQFPAVIRKLEDVLISHVMPVSRLNEAFELAASSNKSIKVVVTQDHD
ncbi:MAG: alcohol dehydrogenase catalytic domain-containing protein [Gammaproteobacteria bacterium]|nr:alcohol dehydrogenase catalytic domain-containing protein [Gammaproteobacteria bacterium]